MRLFLIDEQNVLEIVVILLSVLLTKSKTVDKAFGFGTNQITQNDSAHG